MKVTLVIPTYNEAENVPKLISALFLLPLPDLTLLFVDDNSPDGTGEIIEQEAARHPGRIRVLHRAGKLGLGTAYIMGFKDALQNGAEAVGQMDADFSHPPEKLVEMCRALPECDFVVGSRYVPGGALDERWPLWRKALSRFGNFYARTILGLRQRDVTSGFRLWSRAALCAMPLDRARSNGYVFQVEMSYIAARLELRPREVPIYFSDRRWGKSKMSLRIQLEAAYRVWKLKGLYTDLRRVQ